MSLSFITLWFSSLFLTSFSENEPKTASSPSSSAVAVIPWHNQKRLSWDDFSGVPAPENHHHALTSTNMEMKVKCEGGALKFKVEAVFNPKESWSRNKKSEALLAHEQLHFDLTELHARLLRKTLAQLPNACSRGAADLNKYANQAFNNWHTEQDLYDAEALHGLDKEKQQQWMASVQARLLELEAYK